MIGTNCPRWPHVGPKLGLRAYSPYPSVPGPKQVLRETLSAVSLCELPAQVQRGRKRGLLGCRVGGARPSSASSFSAPWCSRSLVGG